MERQEILSYIDKAILLLLTIQISVVSLSIAVSSIAFGIWLALWLIQFVITRRIKYDKNLFKELKFINIFVLLYCLTEILTRFNAVYPEGAFSNVKRLLLFLIFYISIIKILNYKTLSRILFVNICILSLISLAEIIQYAIVFNETIIKMSFSEIRLDYFNHPLTTAEIKMMSLLSVFPLLFVKNKFVILKKYLLIILVPVFISMLLTQTRNALLGTFLCLLIFGIVSNKKFLWAFIAILIISAIMLPSSLTERTKSIVDIHHPSNSSRFSMWKVGIEMFMDHPLTGVADSHIQEIYKTYKVPEEESEGVHLHNNFIMILATTGLFGFLFYLGMFAFIFIKQIKFYLKEGNENYKMLLLGSILVMISFHISGTFEWSFGDHEVMTVFFFLISVPFVIYKLEEPAEVHPASIDQKV